MFSLYEKYNPAYSDNRQIMTKKIIPGAYLWPVLILTLTPTILGITLHWGWFFVLAFIAAVVLPLYFMCLDLSDFKGGKKHWRLFNRGRKEVYAVWNLPEPRRDGEYKSKLIEYFDALRGGEPGNNKVNDYLKLLHDTEEKYWAELQSIAPVESKLNNIIDTDIIDRLKFETQHLRDVTK